MDKRKGRKEERSYSVNEKKVRWNRRKGGKGRKKGKVERRREGKMVSRMGGTE